MHTNEEHYFATLFPNGPVDGRSMLGSRIRLPSILTDDDDVGNRSDERKKERKKERPTADGK
jgi:hypothetical protein